MYFYKDRGFSYSNVQYGRIPNSLITSIAFTSDFYLSLPSSCLNLSVQLGFHSSAEFVEKPQKVGAFLQRIAIFAAAGGSGNGSSHSLVGFSIGGLHSVGNNKYGPAMMFCLHF